MWKLHSASKKAKISEVDSPNDSKDATSESTAAAEIHNLDGTLISESDPAKEYLQLHTQHQATDTEPSIQDMNSPLSETSNPDSDEIVEESVSYPIIFSYPPSPICGNLIITK